MTLGERLREAIVRRKKFLLQELSKHNKQVNDSKPLCELCLSDLEREYRHALDREKMAVLGKKLMKKGNKN